MITDKIKTLFQFIDFLHDNIINFKKYDNIIEQLNNLDAERCKLSHRNNYKDKIDFDNIQAEIKDKFKVIKDKIILPIRTKAIELNVCNFDKEPLFSWYGVENRYRPT